MTGNTAGISDSASRPDPTEDERAAAFFQDYLLKCRPDEVRCVWFSNGRQRVGMIMTIDLRRETVFTACEVYNWASQATEERRLTHSQVLSVRDVLDQLPASHNTEFRNSACISFDRNGRVKVCRYERIKAPDAVRRLYDLGGGYFDSGPS
jgi:hypothetical protein